MFDSRPLDDDGLAESQKRVQSQIMGLATNAFAPPNGQDMSPNIRHLAEIVSELARQNQSLIARVQELEKASQRGRA